MTKSIHELRVGDRVSFVSSKRGVGKVTGTINRIRTRERRGRARELARAVTGDPHSLDSTVAEIAPDGGGAVWTVPLTMLTYVGEGDRNAAREAVATVKAKRRGNEAVRRSGNYETADAAGLYDLKPGAPIEVELRDACGSGTSWHAATFRGFVAGSGNVRYEWRGRVRTTSPKYVRKPAPAV